MQKWRSWQAASEAEWGLAVEREMVIRPLAELLGRCRSPKFGMNSRLLRM